MEFSPSLAGGSQCGEAVKWRMPRREARAGRRRRRGTDCPHWERMVP